MSTDVHTLSGAYALDALDAAEADEFRRHLAECPACREEVRELRAAAARMGAAEAVPPGPELKARVLAAVDRTPQQPPTLAEQPATMPDQPATVQKGRPEHAARPRLGRWIGAAAAAAVVVVGGVVGIQAFQDDDPALSPSVTQVLDADDARTATVETTNGGQLTVGVSPGRDEMAVDTRRLPDPGDGRVYQLWAVHGTEIVSAGVLEDSDTGAAMGMPEEGTEVALTVEPAGGSEQPTGDPIVQVDPRDLLSA